MTDLTRYTEGVCADGAAILRDGVMMRIEEIVSELNRLTALAHPEPPAEGEAKDEPPVPISAHDLATQWNQQADGFNHWDSLDLSEQLAWAQARAIALDRSRRAPVPPAEGEVTELVAWLQTSAREWRDLGQYSEGAKCHRAAELFQQQHPTPVPVVVPVPVTERPWERGGWLDLDGECWWCPPDGPPCWLMIPPSMAYAGWLLPSHALPVPAGGGAVMITPNRPPLAPRWMDAAADR